MTNQEFSDAETSPASRRILPLLLILFIGSGCAALIYEVVWLQLLQLVIGLTSVSLGVLLGTYMGGMCLGSLLLPRFISTRRHPLRVYAVLELGIGIIGIAVLFGMQPISHLYTIAGGNTFAGILLRAVIAAVCLLPPTLLMGATLPAISRWVETTPRGVSWMGFFYGGNITGAVLGCLLAGFYLLRIHDSVTATFVAAAINVTVALLALLLSSVAPFNVDDKGQTSEIRGQRLEAGLRAAGSGAVYVTIALSGLTALGAEVVWTRLLSLMLGATTYTFSIILAVFLIGLGIGSSAGSFLSRTARNPRFQLGVCQLLLAGTVAWAAYMIASSLPHWPVNVSLAQPFYLFQLDMAMCLWTILPAAILWGASFPLALAAVAARGQDPGRLVGGVYAANTVGAILGALGFSLLVVPLGGTQTGQRLLILLPVLSAFVVLLPLFSRTAATDDRSKAFASGFAGAGTLIGALGLALLLARSVAVIPWGVIAYGRWMPTYGDHLKPGIRPEAEVPQGGGGSDMYCCYMGEGLNGSVVVSLTSDGIRSFHSAGKVQASNEPQDMRLQRMLGHLSALAVPEPKSVLVVACGAGVTAGSFVPYPGIKRIVICDIEPLVPDHVAPMFKAENYDVVHDPRVEIVHDDGRHFIRTTKEKFDIITSDPIDPWVKGCAALNTVEYYDMCKAHLNPGGVVSLWIPLYESNTETIKSVLATFFTAFPNGIFWSNDINGEGYDAVLFGQVEPTHIDVDELQARLDRPEYARVKQSLDDVGFHSAADLLATYAGRAADLHEWMRDAQINTDRNLRLQYLAGMALNNYQGREILSGITKYYRFPDDLFLGSDETRQALKDQLQHRGG
ncbi:MAG TPA: SAM-dependent methyltransferase [Verrucomicrobiae bacterium]|nr:SAM-dependent methyltransferase [Verrucomicrobiae bacterium]